MALKEVLQETITILHRAGKRRVYIKTDGYVPACLNPGDMDFAQRFPEAWLADYIRGEALLGLDGFTNRERQEANMFFVFEDHSVVLHLRVSRGENRHIEYVRV